MSNSGDWGPTPPGVDLTENQNADIIASVVVITALGLFAVALRMFARLSRGGPGLAEDDYMILVAALLGIGTAVCCLISVPWGGGKHLWAVGFGDFTKLYQTTYAFVIVYILTITATKTSILLFYRRLFGTSWIWWIVVTLAVCHGLEVTVTWLSGCRPMAYYWKQYTDPTFQGRCINASVFYFVNGIIGLVIDISVLLVPLRTIYHLHMPMGQKALVYGILLLGSFVCVASIVRIVMMDKLVKSADATWAMCQVFIWSCCEPFIGIVCACLPTYAPLVRHWWPTTKKYGYGSSGATPKYATNKSQQSSKREWVRIGKPGESSVPGEDEVELTTSIVDVTSGTPNDAHFARNGPRGGGEVRNEIVVTKDFSWTRTPVA
ncbi:hypothetical protein M426DRAFT_323974 [Hypoxylon sp. CI-4A]|nr:hypothetical protein M426DRAFT_323974 [Hypoxylon sp. CI-4A]